MLHVPRGVRSPCSPQGEGGDGSPSARLPAWPGQLPVSLFTVSLAQGMGTNERRQGSSAELSPPSIRPSPVIPGSPTYPSAQPPPWTALARSFKVVLRLFHGMLESLPLPGKIRSLPRPQLVNSHFERYSECRICKWLATIFSWFLPPFISVCRSCDFTRCLVRPMGALPMQSPLPSLSPPPYSFPVWQL